LGGIARRVSWIRDNLDGDTDYLLVEAGNTLFKRKHGFTKRDLAKAKLLLDLYQDMDYQAFAIGSYDLGQSKDFILKNFKDNDLKTISANLLYKDKPLFPQYRIIEYNKTKIAIISLTSADINPEISKQGISVTNPEDSLQGLIPILQKKADLILLLSNLGQSKDLELIGKVKAVDLIIGSGKGRVYRRAQQKQNTYLLRVPSKGKVVGKVSIKLNDKNKIEEVNNHFEVLQDSLPVDQKIQAKINRFKNKYRSAASKTKKDPKENPFYQLIKNKNIQRNATNTKAKEAPDLKKMLEAIKRAQESSNTKHSSSESKNKNVQK